MKIFISGASGFIGRAVSSELAKRGHEVTGLVQDEKEGALLEGHGVRHVTGDLFEGGRWCEAVKDADKVISLTKPFTGHDEITKDNVSRFSSRHVEMVTNLIKAAFEGNARQVIVTSHTLCLGDRHGSFIANADFIDPVGYCRPIADPFGSIEKTAEDSGLALVRAYPAMVYGNGGWFGTLVGRFKNGTARVLSPGDNYMNLIHVDDVAGLYASIVEKVEGGDTFILTDSRPVMQDDFMSLIANVMGVPEPGMVGFDEYSRMFGWLEAESMSASSKISGDRAINVLGYSMKVRGYEKGVIKALEDMGLVVRKAA